VAQMVGGAVLGGAAAVSAGITLIASCGPRSGRSSPHPPRRRAERPGP
jgi:hypothetical protein